MVLTSGSQFGPYRILDRLGAGGMASVYHAFQAQPQREVALKVISPELAHQPAFRARFRREANVLAQLEHPNILPIYETGEVEGQPYIGYRYIRGGTLKDVLGPPLSVAEAIRFLAPLADALDFAHRQGVVHRDIKPANILLTLPDADGHRTPIVADFGIARLLESALPGDGTTTIGQDDSAALTQVGVGLGTPAYMAPEQVLGKVLDGRVDQYALAITAYQLLTGAVPFSATTPVEVAFMQVHEPLPLPSRRNPAITPAVEQVLLKALAKSAGDRYPTCGDFAGALAAASDPTRAAALVDDPATLTHELHGAMRADTAPAAAAGTAAPAHRAPRLGGRRWRGWLALLAAVVLVGALASVAIVRNRETGQAPSRAAAPASTAVSPAGSGGAASPVAAGGPRVIFAGALASGWHDTTDAAEAMVTVPPTVRYAGHPTADIRTRTGYSGWRLQTAGVSTQGYTHVRLIVRPDLAGEPVGGLGLGSPAASDFTDFAVSAVRRTAAAEGWLQLDVPLFWFDLGGGVLTNLTIQSDRGEPTTLSVAEVLLVSLPNDPPADPLRTGGVRFNARAGNKPVPGTVVLLGTGQRGVTDVMGSVSFDGILAGRLDYKTALPEAFEGSPLEQRDSGRVQVKAGATVDADPIRAVKTDLHLTSPTQQARVTLPVTLRWQPYAGAAEYEVIVDGPGAPEENPRTVETTFTVGQALAPQTAYTWRVHAYDADGNWIATAAEDGAFRTP